MSQKRSRTVTEAIADLNTFLDVTASRLRQVDALVWLCLLRHTGKNWCAYPSKKRIAESLNVSEKTVQRSLKRLQEEGLVRVLRTGSHHSPSLYMIRPVNPEAVWSESHE